MYREEWGDAKARVLKLALEVSTERDSGTGILLQRIGSNFVIATAWHVIQHLPTIGDKYRRIVRLKAADRSFTAVANAVGVVRLGDESTDAALIWIGPPFSSALINATLHTLALSGIKNGYADFSGGGGIVSFQGDAKNFLTTPTAEVNAETAKKRVNVCVAGYPTKPPAGTPAGDLVFFESTITGYADPCFCFIDWCGRDGEAQKGISGGPVFTEQCQLTGLISTYERNYEAMKAVMLPRLPWAD